MIKKKYKERKRDIKFYTCALISTADNIVYCLLLFIRKIVNVCINYIFVLSNILLLPFSSFQGSIYQFLYWKQSGTCRNCLPFICYHLFFLKKQCTHKQTHTVTNKYVIAHQSLICRPNTERRTRSLPWESAQRAWNHFRHRKEGNRKAWEDEDGWLHNGWC